MNELIITQFENAFGIKKLNINNTNNGINNCMMNNVIYAANGVFKSSFANAFECLKNGEPIEERIEKVKFNYQIKIGSSDINSLDLRKKVLIFSREIMNNCYINSINSQLSKMAMIPEIHRKANIIFSKINIKFNEIVSFLKGIGIEEKYIPKALEIADLSDELHVITTFKNLLSHSELFDNDNLLSFKQLYSSTYDKLDKPEVQVSIQNYHNYIIEKQKSTFFDDKFSLFAANELLKSLKKTEFLTEQRKIVIGNEEYCNYDAFEIFIKNEQKKITASTEVIEKLENVKKSIGQKSKMDLEISNLISTNQDVVELMSISRSAIVRSKIYREYINQPNAVDLINEIYSFCENINRELDELEMTASEMKNRFDEAVDIFKARFSPKFDIKIENHNHLAMGLKFTYPIIKFYHSSVVDTEIDESLLNTILSSGEKTTLNILKFIVMYENIKADKPIIIFDDIIETFDYGNRYAFINYVNEIIKDESNVIVLTSNYEFFRSLSKRTKLKPLGAMEKDRIVRIQKDSSLQIGNSEILNVKSMKDLFYALPYAREIASYNKKEDEFLKLFHIKVGTKRIKNKSVICKINKVLKLNIANPSDIDIEKKFYDSLIEESNKICSDVRNLNMFELKNKIVLSLTIRLMLEDILLRNLKISVTKSITTNQTTHLIKIQVDNMNDTFKKLVEEIKVNIPEFIHLNAFMYEPLVDVSPYKLIILFNELSKYYDKILSWMC